MIKDNQKRLNRVQVLLDGLVIAFSYVLAWYVVIGSNWFYADEEVLPPGIYFAALLFILPVYLLVYGVFNLYMPKRAQGRRVEFANLFKANTIGFLIFALALLWFRKNPYLVEFSLRMVVCFYAVNTVVGIFERVTIRLVLRTMRSSGYNQKHVLLVGCSRAAEGYIDRVLANPEWGYQIYGMIDNNRRTGYEYRGIKVIGVLEGLGDILAMNVLDEIAITLSIREYGELEHIVAACEKSGVHTKFIPDYNNIIPTRPHIEDLMGLPVINIRHVPLNQMFNKIIKRSMDIVGSIAAIIIFSPLMLVTAVLIKLTSKGQVIYSQERIGIHNRPFKMYKFRSMEVQKPEEEKGKWTTPHDPRVTSVGKFIRRTSIDEMPQFFNILRGDMSLVGPRPERPLFVGRFKEEIPRYMIKHQVRPGLTGWAQINGYRGDTSITKRIEHDLYYIENWTAGLDCKILFLTIFKGFINKNAY